MLERYTSINKEQINNLIEKYRYILIGEIHGTKEIPNITFNIIKPIIKKYKVIFCLELPKQVEEDLYDYLNGKIDENKLFSSEYLQDAIFDNRLNETILLMYKELHKYGVIIKCLENYDVENYKYRDKEMVRKFLEVIERYKVDKYFIYIGNIHILDKPKKINNFTVNTLRTYLPKRVKENSLIINFNQNKEKNIKFYNNRKIIYYNLILKEIKANTWYNQF